MDGVMTDPMLVQWSYDEKLNSCSVDKYHEKDCDGNCEQIKATKGQVTLHNEVAAWTAKKMNIVGLPDVISDQIPVNGFPVNILSTDRKLVSLLEFLVEKGIVDEQEYLEYHRLNFAAYLRESREQVEMEQVRASIHVPHIGLAKPPDNGGVQH